MSKGEGLCIWSYDQWMLQYVNDLHSTADGTYEKKGYELHVLNWITRHIYLFHQKFYQKLF